MLEIRDARREVVRRFSSEDDGPGPHPSDTPGLHRFLWDLRHASPAPMVEGVRGTRVPPGQYTVRLGTGAKTLTVPLLIEPDPLRGVSIEEIQRQYAVSRETGRTLRDLAVARASRRAPGVDQALEAELDEMWRDVLRVFVTVEESDTPLSLEMQRSITTLLRAARDLMARGR